MNDATSILPEHNKVTEQLARLAHRLNELRGIFDYDGKREKLEELDAQTVDPSFWGNNDRAQDVLREQSTLKKILADLDEAQTRYEDAQTLYELGREEGDDASIRDAWSALESLDQRVGKMEFRRMLSGPHDDKGALITINAGAGGVDSQDWAQILMRMYLRWGERHGFKVEVLDVQDAEQAGIRSAEIEITGEFAYGYLRSEIGVHRLVRISPFDANARRQTSFASVMALPDLGEDEIDIEVNEADLEVDTFRSSGAGGQHVNKTDSAVRLRHLPTGIVVACQVERSQHKNKATAMRVLKAKLWDLEQQRREAERESLQGERKKIEWGSQIRSYVLQPYQQVNDHRTELKSSAVHAVLDGDLDEFIEAYLLQQSQSSAEAPS
ncbi:peptide chain release factor 2 [Nannocystis sp. ILAH1]|uniref:peptide chain release factor 2 n=1 Tax=unclassified Nannocystis TaxID=2627009 RepID=UPI00226FD570|nr:peptide chain release factor 2 [Nannocystis sp. ILAH1]MCY1069537.1 peptide chain release factor 2 [Nannocystis sp. RBIL2]